MYRTGDPVIIFFGGFARLYRQSRYHIIQQLTGPFIKANSCPAGYHFSVINGQNVLHFSQIFAIYLTDTPLFFEPRLDRAAGQRCIGQIDGEYLAKMEDVLAVYTRPVEAKRPRLCFDERPCQLLDDVVAGLRVEPGKAAKEDNDRVAGAIHPARYCRGAAGL